MAATTENQTKISLKVMVHKKDNRVLFAEADGSFIDILFSFITLPMGTIVGILGTCKDNKFEALRCLKNFYQSLMDLPDHYMSTEESKFMMLNPKSSSYDLCQKLKLILDETKPNRYFMCPNWNSTTTSTTHCSAYFSTCNLARCTYCGSLMNEEMKFSTTAKNPTECLDGGVFVSDVTTFLVTDDLRVMPNTSGCTIRLLCDLGTTDASQLEERTFDIGHEQMLILLQGALLFKYPLTCMVFSHKHLIQDLADPKQGTVIQNLTSNEIAAISKTMTLKVTLQKSSSKFLFAEAEENFADFVFGILKIPLGTVIGKLLNGNSSLESLDNLFASILNMNAGYIKSQDLKDMLIQPQLAWNFISENQIFPLNVARVPLIYPHWIKGWPFLHMTYDRMGCGPKVCKDERFREMRLQDPRVQGRFLKAPAKYMLTDDFVLTPFSSFSTIAMLNKLKVPLSDVVEHEVSIGIEEGLKILKASLKSSGTLSDALL